MQAHDTFRDRDRRRFRASLVSNGVAAAVVLAAGLGAAHADTLTWTGSNGSTTGWTNNWASDGAHTFPQAGDTAQLHVNVSSNTILTIGNGAAVGNLSARPSFGLYRIRSNNAGTRTFTFDNAGSESVVTVSHSANFASNTGLLQFGTDGNGMEINLANDLRISSDAARVANGRIDFGALTTLTGGSSGNRRTITVEALGSSAITTRVGGAATFVGDWVVDGAKATLDMDTNAFGDASNSVTLLDGGVLDLDGLGAVSWTRALAGTGTVKVAGGLTFSASGSLNVELVDDSVSSLINATGAVTLGGTLNIAALGSYTPEAGDSWTILSATGGITGGFATPLPAGYTTDIVGNDLVLSYVPEPAALGLLSIGAVALLTPYRGRPETH